MEDCCSLAYSHIGSCSANFFLFIMIYLYFMCMDVPVCITHAPGAHRGQKKTLDCLELKLEMIVNCYVVLGTESGSTARAVSDLICCSGLLLLVFILYHPHHCYKKKFTSPRTMASFYVESLGLELWYFNLQ